MDPREVELLEDAIAKMAAQYDGPALTDALDEFGWLELLEAAPGAAVPIVFAAQGRRGSWSAAFHDVLATQVGDLETELGPTTATVVLPAPRASAPAQGRGDSFSIDGLCVGARPERRWFVLAARGPAGTVAVLRLPADDMPATATHGLDERLGIERVRGDLAGTVSVLARGADAEGWWSAAEALGRRALCHQICGALAVMLDLALTHARERRQFGQLIGTFQAVRHKLAEAYVAVAAAEAAAGAAWDSDDLGLASATAKLVTSRACSVTVAHTQQVLAGIGFTAEHPYHHLMRRVVVLDRLLGTATELEPMIGRRLASLGDAPRLVQL